MHAIEESERGGRGGEVGRIDLVWAIDGFHNGLPSGATDFEPFFCVRAPSFLVSLSPHPSHPFPCSHIPPDGERAVYKSESLAD